MVYPGGSTSTRTHHWPLGCIRCILLAVLLLTAAPSSAQGKPPASPAAQPAAAGTWFYKVDGVISGPVPTAVIRRLYRQGRLQADSPVLAEGQTDWRYLVRHAGLAHLVSWFYYDEQGRRRGPVSTAQLRSRLEGGELSLQSLVWRRGLVEPQKLVSLPLFGAALSKRAAAPGPELEGPGAATGRAVIGRSELAGSAYVEAQFSALDHEQMTSGRVLLGARIPIGERVALGVEASIPWVAPEEGQGEVAFGNLALLADVLVFGSEGLNATLGLKVYLPTATNADTLEGLVTLGLGYWANTYEAGFHMPYTFTLRPEFKLFARSGGLAIGVEVGFDFLIAIKEQTTLAQGDWVELTRNHESFAGLHSGFKIGYHSSSGLVFGYWELALSKLFLLSKLDGKPNLREEEDPPVNLMTGPGLKLQLRRFELGAAVMIPATQEVRDVLDAVITLQVGGRW